jgi:hypothetical protein
MSIYDSQLKTLQLKKNHYTSPDVQNELLSLMSDSIVSELASDISSHKYYSIMVDETTDAGNIEQLVLCLRSLLLAGNIHINSHIHVIVTT